MLLDERKRAPADEGEYLAEVKYDGYRVLVQFGDHSCQLRMRNGVDCTRWFPEVACSLGQASHGRMIMDGEMCILDGMGRSDFYALQARARRPTLTEGDTLVTFCAFDLLADRGRSLLSVPLIERKAALAALLVIPPTNVLYARHIAASDVENPISWVYARALELQLEGVVGKRADSPYRPGERSANWFKLKRPAPCRPSGFTERSDRARRGKSAQRCGSRRLISNQFIARVASRALPRVQGM